ncbi:eukaryotic rRNA processing protein EBP2-domain-containing protein [Myxozyma melibiosi]|uniref:Eukaryotic rRNA processing protein EBP2-domain-containing protein n=1 Tax=Myxozyma melibiosi TaxID=54550 RepID=A0ABR1F7J6_9ASCO
MAKSKLKVALDRERGVDRRALKEKEQLKKKQQVKVQKKTGSASVTAGNGEERNSKRAKVDVSEKSKKGKKAAPAPVEESEDENEEEEEDEEFDEEMEGDDDSEEEYEEGDDDDDDAEGLKNELMRMIDTANLEDDLSSDSESDDEDVKAIAEERKKATKAKKEEVKSQKVPAAETKPEKKADKKADKKASKAEKANAKKRAREEEEEEEIDPEDDGIPFSDVPTDSEDDDDSDAAAKDIVPYQRLTINNTKALASSLSSIALPYSSIPFFEHMGFTASEELKIDDVENELQRELAFYNQALEAATKGRGILIKDKVPFARPEDYFAEMVKSDEHMEKLARHHTTLAAEAGARKGGAKPAGTGKSAKSGKSKKPRHKK